MSESAGVALAMFVVHVFTLTAVCITSAIYAFFNVTTLHENLQQVRVCPQHALSIARHDFRAMALPRLGFGSRFWIPRLHFCTFVLSRRHLPLSTWTPPAL